MTGKDGNGLKLGKIDAMMLPLEKSRQQLLWIGLRNPRMSGVSTKSGQGNGSQFGEQGWRSGESTRLPQMWPGFKSRS